MKIFEKIVLKHVLSDVRDTFDPLQFAYGGGAQKMPSCIRCIDFIVILINQNDKFVLCF